MGDHISPWVGIAGLAVTVILAIISGAFFMGRLSERVDSMKADGLKHEGLAIAVAELKTTVLIEMKNQTEKLSGLRDDLVWLRKAAFYEIGTPREDK